MNWSTTDTEKAEALCLRLFYAHSDEVLTATEGDMVSWDFQNTWSSRLPLIVARP